MASPRRIGAPDAKNRAVLLDAAEQLILDQGYAAVTSRKVAEHAGLKPQLVHYYFRSMDELLLEVFRRRAEQGLELQQQLMRSRQPLHALWEFSIDPAGARITMEFIALANHNPAVRAEVARYAEKFRDIQIETLEKVLDAEGIDAGRFPPGALAVLMTSISRVVILEQALGMSGGHAEALELVRRELERIEGPPAQDNTTGTSEVT